MKVIVDTEEDLQPIAAALAQKRFDDARLLLIELVCRAEPEAPEAKAMPKSH